jgi:hypothetical protein
MRELYLRLHPDDIIHLVICEISDNALIPTNYLPDDSWIRYYFCKHDSPFPLSKGRNFIIKTGFDYDRIAIWDLDLIVFPDHFIELMTKMRLPGVLIKGFSYFNYSKEETIQNIPTYDWKSYLNNCIYPDSLNSTIGSGIICGDRDTFYKSKGFDERFVGWGYEDNAFKQKITALKIPVVTIDKPASHLWHPGGSQNGSNFFVDQIEKIMKNLDILKENFSEQETISKYCETITWNKLGIF